MIMNAGRARAAATGMIHPAWLAPTSPMRARKKATGQPAARLFGELARTVADDHGRHIAMARREVELIAETRRLRFEHAASG
jgi:hypothetical protein